MIFKKEVWITPYQMNRRLHIYVPQRAMEEGRRCPVLYMFDGHNLFEDQEATYGKSWGLKDYLDHSGLPLSWWAWNATTRATVASSNTAHIPLPTISSGRSPAAADR